VKQHFPHISTCLESSKYVDSTDNIFLPVLPYICSRTDSHVLFLSINEIFDILFNPDPLIRMVEIIFINPEKYQFHTIQVLNTYNTRSRYYDTNDRLWIVVENNKDLFNKLLNSMRMDLKILLEGFSIVLEDNIRDHIKCILISTDNILESNKRYRNRIIRTIKKHLYANKQMLVNSMKHIDRSNIANNIILKKNKNFRKKNHHNGYYPLCDKFQF
jgi:hypothetical protein